MVATPSHNKLPLRAAAFATLAEALDYAAEGDTGCNFYTGRGELYAVLSYAELREQAQALARRFHSLNLERGSRVALIAETHPDFLRFFFACQYAGLVPVPLPVSINLAVISLCQAIAGSAGQLPGGCGRGTQWLRAFPRRSGGKLGFAFPRGSGNLY